MRSRLHWLLLLPALLVGPAVSTSWAQASAQDKDALAKNATAFVEAFQKGDSKAVAAFWSPEGEYVDMMGRTLKGRDAIEKAFGALFADVKDLKVRITSESLRFLTPDVAIEEGVTDVITPDGAPPSRSRFVNVHVKKDGKWLLGSVKDSAYVPSNNAEKLGALDWAMGQWASEGDKGPIERLAVSWGEQQNFIHASFLTSIGNVSVGNVLHWIGWDPEAKQIRSWSFDATGGFGEGAWSTDGKKWTIKTKSVHQDGKKVNATVVFGPVDGDTLTLQVKDRTVDGKAVPDTKEIKLKRLK